MAEVRRVVRNPADPESGYRLWSNAYVEPYGDALPVDWSTRYPHDPAYDLVILDWLTPAGTLLTNDGAGHGFGGGPSWGALPAGPYRIYRFLILNPDGLGQGYCVDFFGDYAKVGVGTPDISPEPPVWGRDIVRDFAMDWDLGDWIQLRGTGGASSSLPIVDQTWTAHASIDSYRRLRVVTWDGATALDPPPFYVGNAQGDVLGANGAEDAHRGPKLAGRGDALRGLDIISDGTGGDPLILALVDASGGELRYTAAAVPTVVLEEPTGTITDTNTPRVLFRSSSENGDAQEWARVKIWTAAVVEGVGFDADTSPSVMSWDITERNVMSVEPDQYLVPLVNGAFYAGVAVRNTSGQYSEWAVSDDPWEIDVTAPTAPSITATPWDDWTVRLAVTGGDDAVDVQYSDDEGVTWLAVLGSPIEPDATLFDPEAPFNRERWYRARSIDGDLTSDWSDITVTTLAESSVWVLGIGSDLCLINDHAERIVPPGLDETLPYEPGVHDSADAEYPVVVRTTIRSPRFDLAVQWFTAADRDALLAFLKRKQTMLLRGPFGHHMYIDVAGSISRQTTDAQSGEPYGSYSVPVVVVGRP